MEGVLYFVSYEAAISAKVFNGLIYPLFAMMPPIKLSFYLASMNSLRFYDCFEFVFFWDEFST